MSHDPWARTERMRCGAVLVAVLASPATTLHAEVGGGEASGNEVSVTTGYLTESDVLDALEQGTEGNCFLDSITFGIDECQYDLGVVDFEMVCVRCDMNVPMALAEASDRQGLLSIDTPDLENDMRNLNANMSPAEKTMVQRVGDFVSASATTQGRCINMFLVEDIIKQVLDGISFDILCSPLFESTHMPFGYGFASEGDHQNGTEFGNWRGIVSDYWYVPWLTPFTAVARALETPGLCVVDWYKMFCHRIMTLLRDRILLWSHIWKNHAVIVIFALAPKSKLMAIRCEDRRPAAKHTPSGMDWCLMKN